MSRKNSKKEPASSGSDDVPLTTINEEDLPEVSGENSPASSHTNAPFGFYLDPGITDQVEQFTPHQEVFLKTLLEASTQHLIRAHAQAVQTQHEEMLRLQRKMQDMQDKIDSGSNRTLTSMETPRAIRPQDAEYQSCVIQQRKLTNNKRTDHVSLHSTPSTVPLPRMAPTTWPSRCKHSLLT